MLVSHSLWLWASGLRTAGGQVGGGVPVGEGEGVVEVVGGGVGST